MGFSQSTERFCGKDRLGWCQAALHNRRDCFILLMIQDNTANSCQ